MQADAVVKELTGGAMVMGHGTGCTGPQGHEGAQREGSSHRPRPQRR
jgi:hypothetical protein